MQATQHGPEAFPDSGHQRPEEEELRQFKREVEMTRMERDIFKKSGCDLLALAAVKFRFIQEHRDEDPISVMCWVLEVSVSGFYAWRTRPLCARKREDGERAQQIEEAFEQNREVYGSPRIHAELQAQGIHCRCKRIVRLMQELEIFARRPVHRVITARSDPSARVAPNELQQDFTVEAINCKWVTDVRP